MWMDSIRIRGFNSSDDCGTGSTAPRGIALVQVTVTRIKHRLERHTTKKCSWYVCDSMLVLIETRVFGSENK